MGWDTVVCSLLAVVCKLITTELYDSVTDATDGILSNFRNFLVAFQQIL
jgi:hypothetical protein